VRVVSRHLRYMCYHGLLGCIWVLCYGRRCPNSVARLLPAKGQHHAVAHIIRLSSFYYIMLLWSALLHC
jgi:hypothetical protein